MTLAARSPIAINVLPRFPARIEAEAGSGVVVTMDGNTARIGIDQSGWTWLKGEDGAPGSIANMASIPTVLAGTDTSQAVNSAGVKAAIDAVASSLPFAHPLSGGATVIYRDGVKRPWAGPQWTAADGVRRLVIREAWRHEYSLGGSVKVFQTYDGRKLINPNTIFSIESRAPVECVGGRMGGTRTGFIVTTQDASAAVANYFCYSDDGDLEYAAPVTVTTPAPIFTYGKMLNFPNGDGSANVNKWIVFGYGAGHIYWMATDDNGATITNGDAFGGALTGFSPVEAYVEKFPGENKWVMIIRDDAGGPAWMSVTTDIKNWPAPVVTSLAAGANPLSLIFHANKLYIYAVARRGTPISGVKDAVVAWSANPATVAATMTPGSPDMHVVYSGSTHLIGYFNPMLTDNGYWEAAGTAGETPLGSQYAAASHIVMLSGIQSEVASPAIIARPSNPNLFDNGAMQVFTRPAGSLSDGVVMADRVQFMGAATGTFAPETVNYALSQAPPHQPAKGLRLVTSAVANTGLYQRKYGESFVRRMQDAPVTLTIHGAYTWPTAIFVRSVFRTAKSGGTDVAGTVFQLRGDAKSTGQWTASITYRTPNLTGYSLGADPSHVLQIYGPLAEAWNGLATGVKFELGDTATPLDPGLGDDPGFLMGYAETQSFGPGQTIGTVTPFGTNTGICALEYRAKPFAPSVTIGSYSNLVVVTSAGNVTVSAIALADAPHTPGTNRCLLKITAAGLTLPGDLMVNTGGSASFLVAVDH